jgi:sialate O-acetylesterase
MMMTIILVPRFSVRRILLLVLALAAARWWPSIVVRRIPSSFWSTGTDGGHHDGDDLLSLRLPTFFSDHMVISSEKPSIWGKLVVGSSGAGHPVFSKAERGTTYQQTAVLVVNVRVLKGRVVSDTNVEVLQEDWHVQLLPQAPGVGYTIQIEVLDTARGNVVLDMIRLTDVAFGDVFLCSGQSNMEMAVHGVFNASAEIMDSVQYPELRLFTADRNTSTVPEWDVPAKTVNASWTVSGPGAMSDQPFSYPSAVCYFTGRDVFSSLRSFNRTDDMVIIPVGLVIIAWGGMPIEYFSSPSALAKCNSSAAAAPVDDNGSCIWNGMVSAFAKFHFRAALWYQGEANSHDPANYACRFPAMIADWRDQFLGDATLPFYYVQLAPYVAEDYCWIRAAQEAAVLRLPAVYAATTIDLGDPTSPFGAIHPRRKQEVGRRLAVQILVHEYGYNPQTIAGGESPSVDEVFFHNNDDDNRISLAIRAPRHQLHWQGTAACSECCYELPFTVLDRSTGNWTRSITSGHVMDGRDTMELLVSPNVDAVALRYAWEGYPQCVIYDGWGGPDSHFIGLPVAPFEWCRYPTGKPSWTGEGCGLAEQQQQPPPPPGSVPPPTSSSQLLRAGQSNNELATSVA